MLNPANLSAWHGALILVYEVNIGDGPLGCPRPGGQSGIEVRAVNIHPPYHPSKYIPKENLYSKRNFDSKHYETSLQNMVSGQ